MTPEIREFNSLTFGQALEKLKEGKKVKRKHWLGYWEISTMTYMEDLSDWMGRVIVARRLGGNPDLNAPATAYQEDMLAEDWEVVE